MPGHDLVRATALVEERSGREHLDVSQVRAEARADATERMVADAGERREHDRVPGDPEAVERMS